MNFNKEKQKIGFWEAVFESTAEQSLDADINLPDYCPEIQRILKCSVTPNINAVQNTSGRITADVNAVVRLLYVGESGKIAAYEQGYPIQKFTESNKINSECSVNVNVNPDYVNCRAVNPRRIDIRAMMTFTFKAYQKRNEDILCFAEGAGIQTMKKACNFASLSGVCEKLFSMSEVVELTQDKKTISQIINTSSSAIPKDVKIINNKALIKGDCAVKIYYIGEDNNTIECIEHSMPISQIIEIDGINENSVSSLRLSITSCEAVPKVDSSGETRLIDLNARISAFMTAFDETPLELITDAYSTDYDLKTANKSIEILNINDSINTSFTNKVVFESIGVSIDCVQAVWCSDIKYSFSSKDDLCAVNGTYQATVLYKDSDNQISMIQKPVDFDFSVKLKEKTDRVICHGSVQLLACSCAVTGDSRFELKTEMLVSGVVLSSSTHKYINSIEITSEGLKTNRGCALTLYFCDKGESVWNIARKYNTTVDAIMNENEMNSDIIENSGMILIPGA